MPPTYGVDQIIRGDGGIENPPPGWATLIPMAGISVDKIDLFITGWMEPTYYLESKVGTERVESGAIITDHLIAMPIKLRMMGMVSDIAMGPDSAGRAWGEITRLYKEETILKVITEWTMIDEAVIRSVTTTQTGRGMEFQIELQEIVRVGVSPTSVAAGIPNNAASERQEAIDGGAKELITAPVTVLGDGRFRVGSATDPDAQIVVVDAQGNVTRESDGEFIGVLPGNYSTIPPAE